ncbi:MAG: fluoride efflux transporter CrcB [Planctomycetota bacterium]
MPNILASMLSAPAGTAHGPDGTVPGTIALQIVAVGIGGGLGAIARFVVGLVARGLPLPPYAATLTVNLIGCYGIGLAFAALSHAQAPGWLRAMLITGVLGAFTTFSTFSLESLHLVERRAWGHLSLNVSASVIIGFLAVWLGLLTANRISFAPLPPAASAATASQASERDT